jgi:hypothetical protein
MLAREIRVARALAHITGPNKVGQLHYSKVRTGLCTQSGAL